MRTISEFMKVVASFRSQAATFQSVYDDLVTESVQLVWYHGDISPVNALIEATSVLKGFNRRALVTFYRDVIPFTFDQKAGLFSKKDANKVAAMGGTLGSQSDDSMGAKVTAHLMAVDWHDENKEQEAKPYIFNAKRAISGLESMLLKGLASHTVTDEALKDLREGIINTIQNVHNRLHKAISEQAITQATEKAA